MGIIKSISIFKLFFLISILSNYTRGKEGNIVDSISEQDSNGTQLKEEIIRVINPGIFDYQSKDFMIRMRAWGVEFPKRGQPGYNEALTFTEQKLLSTSPNIQIRQEFDVQNLKVVELTFLKGQMNFSREAISLGIGWHLEKETKRYGSFVLSQIKAKRLNLGIWANNFNYKQIQSTSSLPTPRLPGMINNQRNFVPSLTFWVSTFGKIHRPNCSFYQRGRGNLTSKPQGTDCRICGGRKPK